MCLGCQNSEHIRLPPGCRLELAFASTHYCGNFWKFHDIWPSNWWPNWFAARFALEIIPGRSFCALTFDCWDKPWRGFEAVPFSVCLSCWDQLIGALFTPQTTNSSEIIRETLIAGSTPSPRGPAALATAVEKILELYPDIPADGSPFNTGNDTFGLNSQYKRFAAIREFPEHTHFSIARRLHVLHAPVDDFNFQSQRRFFIQTLSNAGVRTFGYLFTDPDAVVPPGLTAVPPAPGSLGSTFLLDICLPHKSDQLLPVTHATEIFYVYDTLANPTPTAITISGIMMDYWISFAASLDPNDNHGSQREVVYCCYLYISDILLCGYTARPNMESIHSRKSSLCHLEKWTSRLAHGDYS